MAASRTIFAASLIALGSFAPLVAQQDPLDQAAADFEQGRAAEAAQKLDVFLKDHPADLRALILKGAALDSLQRYDDAEPFYQRALKIAPGSAQVSNNAANHYLARGDRRRARELYLKTVTLDPEHVNANLQLAQMSVDDKRGAEALVFLNRLGDSVSRDPGAQLVRARALALTGRCSDASKLLTALEAQPSAEPAVFFSSGMAFAGCKQYERAESSFSRVLDANPRDFDVLYNLGLAALEAGHNDRASSVLETALRERPDDVDCLYALARAYLQNRPVDAAALLTRAQKMSPGRADVPLLLAQITARLGFFGDAAAAYEEYLKLKPRDDAARREHDFMLACGNRFKTALPGLSSYVKQHPRDAIGFYELAIAQAFEDRPAALDSLSRALSLDSALSQALFARALLRLEEQQPSGAIEDLRQFLERQPGDVRAMANLGKAYLESGRADDAADVLKRATELAPNDPMSLVQYRRALVKLHRTQEASAVLSRLQAVSASSVAPHPQAGLVEYLSLSPAGRRERYLANLRRDSANSPGDLALKMRLARELLAEGNTAESLHVFGEIQAASQDPRILSQCGTVLLDFERYADARPFLELALARDPSLALAHLDLALARFHLENASASLQELDKTPALARQGDYYLLRAQVLDAQGKLSEAADALNKGMQASPSRPVLYLQAAGFLLKHKMYDKALAVLEQASRILPDDRDLLLAQAVTFTVMPRDEDAQKLLAKIQARWPEWDRPYLLNGMILEMQLKSAEALPLLETAIALGADTPEAHYYHALAITHARPDDAEGAYQAIRRATALTANDPYIYLLAGKISFARKNYPEAIRDLERSTALLPTLIPAHYTLHDAYKAVGDEKKSAAELAAIQQIADKNAASGESPFPVEDFVFRVRPTN